MSITSEKKTETIKEFALKKGEKLGLLEPFLVSTCFGLALLADPELALTGKWV